MSVSSQQRSQHEVQLDDKFHSELSLRSAPREQEVHSEEVPGHDLLGRRKFTHGLVEEHDTAGPDFFLDASHLLPGHKPALRYGIAVLDGWQ